VFKLLWKSEVGVGTLHWPKLQCYTKTIVTKTKYVHTLMIYCEPACQITHIFSAVPERQFEVVDYCNRAAVGIRFQSPYPSHTHRKTSGNPHIIPIPTEPRNAPYFYPGTPPTTGDGTTFRLNLTTTVNLEFLARSMIDDWLTDWRHSVDKSCNSWCMLFACATGHKTNSMHCWKEQHIATYVAFLNYFFLNILL